MPEKFTRAFAERLDRRTAFDVREAEDGDALAAGRVLIAPGGRHLDSCRDGARSACARSGRAPGAAATRAGYCPSVDRLFASAAEACGRAGLRRGPHRHGQRRAAGVAAVKARGRPRRSPSPSETAVVYGMPKAAAEAAASTSCSRSTASRSGSPASRAAPEARHDRPRRRPRRGRQPRDAAASRRARFGASRGSRPREAADGADAWRKLAAGSFDVVVTDIHMPILDGLKLIGLVRAGGAHRGRPIVVITTEAAEADRAARWRSARTRSS